MEHLDPQGAADAGVTRSYGEALPEVCERLARTGACGVVLVDADALVDVEARCGVEAHRTVHAALGRAVDDATRGARGDLDLVVSAGGWRDEVAVTFFRPRDDTAFYREALPAIATGLSDHFEKNGGRLFYPHLRSAPPVHVGTAIVLHSPVAESLRLVRDGLAAARAEARFVAEQRARERRRRFTELVLAEEIEVLYEPIVNLSTREVLGYEALSRGPAGSDVRAPGPLFQRAQESGLLYEVDSVCRRQALQGARGLPAGRKLFLNCLPAAIRDPSFRGDALRRRLETMELRPQDVVFEITEQESIGNVTLFREARDHFASLGLGIAMDDMGIGYSSLARLLQLEPDYVKIDQSLVRGIDADPARQELLRSLEAVATRLGARLIGEGIETSEELAVLQGLGIPFGQGYLLGRAAPLRRQR